MLYQLPRRTLIATALTLSVFCSAKVFSDNDEPAYQYGPFYTYPNEQKKEKPVATGNSSSWNGMNYPKREQQQAQPRKDPPKKNSSKGRECKTAEEWKKSKTQQSYGPFYSYSDSESPKQSPARQKPKMKAYPRIKPILEAKAGYFFFTDHKLKKVYDQGGLDLQIAASYPIWRWFQIYLSAEFFERKGRSLHFHERTRVWGWPVSLGLKTVATINCWSQYYFTIGPRYFYFHMHNNSSHVDRELNHSAIGGFIGTGFDFYVTKHFIIDIFGEYSYCRTNFHAHKDHTYGEDRQIGGFTFGGGLGYAF